MSRGTPQGLDTLSKSGRPPDELTGVVGFTPFEIVPLQSLELLDQLEGFPIRVRWSENGRITSEIRVTSIEPLEAVDALFEPPAEFRRRPGFTAPAAAASAP